MRHMHFLPVNCSRASETEATSDLLDWLKQRGPEYEHALSEPRAIRVAIDRVHANRETPIGSAGEVALFPPMTGG